MNNKILMENPSMKKIVNFINKPTIFRRLTLFFGSGINNNIASNPIDWNELSKNSLKEFFKDKKSKRNNFEIDSMTNNMYNYFNNNKLLLSFAEKTKIDLNLLPLRELEWFEQGYFALMNRMNRNVRVITTNYDLLIDSLFNRKPINIINESSKNENQEVIHIHGVTGYDKYVKEESLLKFKDYVNNSKKIEDKISDLLIRNVDDKSKYEELIIIIGSSLQEEHLIRSLNNFAYDSGSANVILINHLPDDDDIVEKVKEIYSELKIEVFNINIQNDYNSDFKNFWKILSSELSKGKFDNLDDIAFMDDVIDSKLYNFVKNKLNDRKNLDLKELFSNILQKSNSENNYKKHINTWIRPIFWLEKNDGILKLGSLQKYMFEYLETIPLDNLHFLRNDKIERKKLIKLLETFNETIEKIDIFDRKNITFNIISFLNFHPESNDLIHNYKNLLIFLKRESALLHNRMNENLRNIIKDKTEVLDGHDFEKYDTLDEYPSRDNSIYKILNDEIEKAGHVAGHKVPTNMSDFKKMIRKESKKNTKHLVFYTLFQIPKFKDFIVDNMDAIIALIDKGPYYNNEKWSEQYLMHILLYTSLIRDKEYIDIYIRKMREDQNSFHDFPLSMDIIWTWGSNHKQYSVYDGQSIKGEIKVINNMIEFDKLNEMSVKDMSTRKAIVNFIKNNFSSELLKKIKKSEWFDHWNFVYEEIAIINSDTWNMYKDNLQIMIDAFNKFDSVQSKFIEILPPYNIYDRVKNLSEEFESVNYKGDRLPMDSLTELLEISDIKNIMRVYEKSNLMWWNDEIDILIKSRKKSQKIMIYIHKIFKKVLDWNSELFEGLLVDKKLITNYYHFTFYVLYSENKEYVDSKDFIKFLPDINEELFNRSFKNVVFTNLNRQTNIKSKISDLCAIINRLESIENINRYILEDFTESIIWIYLNNEVKLDFSKITIRMRDVFQVIYSLKDLSPFDEKLREILNKSITGDDDFSSYFLWSGQLVKRKCGAKTIEWFKSKIINILNSLDEMTYMGHTREVYSFIREYFTNDEIKGLEKKLDRIDTHWRGEL